MLQQVYVIFLKCGTGYGQEYPISALGPLPEWENLQVIERIPYRDKDYLLLPYYLFE